jgi:hypothetical protein
MTSTVKHGLMLTIGAALACGADKASDPSAEAPASVECDPTVVEDLPPGYARIDGCPGNEPNAAAWSWIQYCADNPSHERCSGACGDAGVGAGPAEIAEHCRERIDQLGDP